MLSIVCLVQQILINHLYVLPIFPCAVLSSIGAGFTMPHSSTLHTKKHFASYSQLFIIRYTSPRFTKPNTIQHITPHTVFLSNHKMPLHHHTLQ